LFCDWGRQIKHIFLFPTIQLRVFRRDVGAEGSIRDKVKDEESLIDQVKDEKSFRQQVRDT
jgi:hypothetical protein